MGSMRAAPRARKIAGDESYVPVKRAPDQGLEDKYVERSTQNFELSIRSPWKSRERLHASPANARGM